MGIESTGPEALNTSFEGSVRRLVQSVTSATHASANEANLRHAIENALERECVALGIPWTPYQLERRVRDQFGRVGFADVVHGAVIIEYEPPSSFGGRQGATLAHAKEQAEEYARRMAREEGRPLNEYILVTWDGAHVAFGRMAGEAGAWDRLVRFDFSAAERLLQYLGDQGMPLVHPAILRSIAGPDSAAGAALIPRLYEAIVASDTPDTDGGRQTKTTLLYREWRRLFGQAVGIETNRLQDYLAQQSTAHGVRYADDIPAYLFSLHTYIAFVAKLVAAFALPNPSENIADSNVRLQQRLQVLESGKLFVDAGIANMLSGDFFSWYVDDRHWNKIELPIDTLVGRMKGVSFNLQQKHPESVRDLFKGLYEVFVPRELRHALGEVYTPDWLAAHALDVLKWHPNNDLLDPTCGTGTFILEAIKRRLVAAQEEERRTTVDDLLNGLYGIELNPLAVLGAKASIVVVLSSFLTAGQPVVLPIYLADAINSAGPAPDGSFIHNLQTELGIKQFVIPGKLVRSSILYRVFDVLRVLIDQDYDAPRAMQTLDATLLPLSLTIDEMRQLESTIAVLVDLHQRNWNGIWCPILADRFAAGAIPRVTHIAGNPPWVKWSHLPPAYAEFIKPMCQAMGVFSNDRYVGGIESDISTVITFAAIRKWLAPEGKLAFFITAPVFSNESSQGFRRFEYNDGTPMAAVQLVEDYQAVAPFDGVTNHPALLVVKQGSRTSYPVRYVNVRPGSGSSAGQQYPDATAFRKATVRESLLARPVPGTDSGPWLKGTAEQHQVWDAIFDASMPSHYRARKGVTTDLNGVYFVRVEAADPRDIGLVWIENDPRIGRKTAVAQVRKLIEREHAFPLLRGKGLGAFRAVPDAEFRVVIPQRGMHGNPALPETAPRTFAYLSRFQELLAVRGSYRRYQSKQPFWSTWSTGPYTFSPYKVLWKEMSGKRYCAAYIGSFDDPVLGEKVVVPDHKLYFVPVEHIEEAQYLTAILNAPQITTAISAYAAQLSLGISVIENLKLPAYDSQNPDHARLAQLAAIITTRGGQVEPAEREELDRVAFEVVSKHT